MRGYPAFNFPAFFEAAKRLRGLGHEVWSPAENDVEKDGFDPMAHSSSQPPHTLAHYMERDLPAVCWADAVACLPGWEKSEGANIEVCVARKVGKQVLTDTLEPIPLPDFKPTNAKDRAATSRLDISLFPSTAIAYGALGMTEGDCKYGAYNFREGGVLASIYISALLRHTMRWYNGQNDDTKTKVPHLASMLCCVAIIIDAVECGVLKDDRPPKSDLSGLLSRFEDIVKHLHTTFPNGPDRFTIKNT